MFGIKKLLHDLKNALERITRLENWRNCQNDRHVWETRYRLIQSGSEWGNYLNDDPTKPYVSCKHCYKELEEKK